MFNNSARSQIEDLRFSRRGLLHIGRLTLGGISLTGVLQMRKAAAENTSHPPKSVILLWMTGGPSHIDMIDLKPEATTEIRGPFQPIDTTLPGFQVCELMPGHARVAKHLAVIRSLTHTYSVHDDAQHLVQTGYAQLNARQSGQRHPCQASVMSYFRRSESKGMPAYVCVPEDYRTQAVSSMILIAIVKVIASKHRRTNSRTQPLIDIDAFPFSGIQEPVSCLTHLLAAPMFAILGYFLVQRGRGNWGRTFSLAVMVVSTVFLLSVSGVYHLLGPGAGRDVMLQLDVAGIFALIAGTVTPVHAILFRGFNRWVPLLLVWSAAVIGITLTTISRDRIAPGVGTETFLLMGWGGLISCILLWKRFGFLFVRPLILGGVAYTAGAVILSLKPPPLVPGLIRAHELWHVAVLFGLGLHWKFVFQFAGEPPDADR